MGSLRSTLPVRGKKNAHTKIQLIVYSVSDSHRGRERAYDERSEGKSRRNVESWGRRTFGTASQRAEGNMASEEQHDMAETPMETFERVFGTINEQLADDLLTEIMNQSPGFFESLVVDLMKAMNYGDGFVTKLSGDDGIDGIIHEDKLGFNLIYIQAKRWKPEITVGKPEIQKFAGAMMGPPRVEKGLFITTAKFSQKAREFADAQHIILVDGQKLTELMIEYGIGVSAQKTYCIKRIDSDYFSDNII